MNKTNTRTSFVFSSSLLQAIDKLPQELKGEFMIAIVNYAIRGEEPKFFDLADVIWQLIRDIIDRDNVRRDSAQRNLSEARSKKNKRKEEEDANNSDGGTSEQNDVCTTQLEEENKFDEHKEKDEKSLCDTNEKFVRHKEKVCVIQTVDTKKEPEKANFGDKGGTIGGDNIPATIRKERLPTGVQRKENLSVVPIGTTRTRKVKFGEDVWAYRTKYTREMLKAFYDYWSEENRSGTKMRFEMEKTWQLGRRLAVWANRDNQFGKNPYIAEVKTEKMDNIMAHVTIEPEKTQEEKDVEQKNKYLFFIQKADKSGVMSKNYRDMLTTAYNNGELERYGIQWTP